MNPASETLACKPDWPQARRRWTAFWEMANTDRPLLDIQVRIPTAEPEPRAASPEQHWTDPEHLARLWEHLFRTTWWGGEAVPTGRFFTGGYALGCGPGVVFDWRTVWHPVLMRSIHDPIGFDPGPHDPWTRRMEAVVRRLQAGAPGRYLVSQVTQVMANDLLYAIRGGEDFLVDLANDLDLCVRRLDEVLERWCASIGHFRALGLAPGAGCTWGWPGLWRERYFSIVQSDISCMLSPAMFRDYVGHELKALDARGLEPIWYHVDGPKAYRHVPALLELPFLRVLQFVPGAGAKPNGPAWIDIYRQVQAAGRGLDLHCPWDGLEYLIRHLRPGGVVLRSSAPSQEAAEELIANAPRWAGSHAATR